jgi:hypothetical protein
MDDLTIRDQDGDAFTLSKSGESSKALLDQLGGQQVEISRDDAYKIVTWLLNCFDIRSNPERVAGFGQSLTVTTGEVSWMGDDSPPAWLEQLARTALGDQSDVSELRALVDALGAETPEVATEIAQTWRTWLDEAGRVLIRAGVADATQQTVIDPVKAINKLLNQHAAALKRQDCAAYDRERQIRGESARAGQSAVAREREARAAVQERLNKVLATLGALHTEIASNREGESGQAWIDMIDAALQPND